MGLRLCDSDGLLLKLEYIYWWRMIWLLMEKWNDIGMGLWEWYEICCKYGWEGKIWVKGLI